MIFLDANFIISLYIKEHEYHDRAVKIWDNIREHEKIVSNLIIPEVITVLNVKLKQHKDLLKKVFYDMTHNFIILNDTDSYYKGFLKVLEHEKRLPLFDGIYIAIMKDLGIKEIVSFDNENGIVRIH